MLRWGVALSVAIASLASVTWPPTVAAVAAATCPSGAVPYASGADWTGYQCMDVDRPPGSGPFPAVVFVHGGAWKGGAFRAADGWREDAAELARQGYVTFNIEYDRSSVGRNVGYLREPADIRLAVEHVRTQAAAYDIDPSRIGLVGDSAGGHLSLLAAYRDVRLAAVVSWSGPGDLAELTRAFGCGNTTCADSPSPQLVARAAQLFVGRCVADEPLPLSAWPRCPTDRYALTAPVSWADASDAPTLLAAATEDPVIPTPLHVALAEAARAAGIPVREVIVPGVLHGRQLRETPSDPPGLWAAETLPFLDDCVRRPPCTPSGTGFTTTSNQPEPVDSALQP